MANAGQQPDSVGDAQGAFATTHWSVVLAAKDSESLEVDGALEALCRSYWYPLYVFVRRRGYSPHDAQDLTQEFFARLLHKDYLRSVDRRKGKFRSFLLAALEHFLANEWRRSQAEKRGGKVQFIPMDQDTSEQRYLQVPASGLSPEAAFEQQWATAILQTVLKRLRQEFMESDKSAAFDELKVYLTGEKPESSYDELAAKIGKTPAALKMAVSRMRHRYGELLREEIAHTVSNPLEVEEEMRALFAALSS
jgi:RNA polymerase sigma-70 factor (ECF subfamily)